jgi:hypothetical protein
MMAKTKFAGSKNPFTGESKLKRVDADLISITNDPMPERRVRDSKYDHLFASLKPGQSLRVPSASVSSVSQGVRKWLEKNGTDSVGRVKAAVNYPGDAGFGRIWLVEPGKTGGRK